MAAGTIFDCILVNVQSVLPARHAHEKNHHQLTAHHAVDTRLAKSVPPPRAKYTPSVLSLFKPPFWGRFVSFFPENSFPLEQA